MDKWTNGQIDKNIRGTKGIIILQKKFFKISVKCCVAS